MALTQDLINQVVKLTTKDEKPKETIVNGVYRVINDEEFVQIDGSDILTPVNSMVEAEDGERVKLMIKNHTAIVTNNISSPSARSKSVQDLKDEIDEQGNTIKQLDNSIEQQGNSIIQINNNITQMNNSITQANNAINQQGNLITQLGNEIDQQGDDIESLNNTVTAHGNQITSIGNTVTSQGNTIQQYGNTLTQHNNLITQQGNVITQHGTTIDQHDATLIQHSSSIATLNSNVQTNASNITILNSGFSIVDGQLTGLSSAIIDSLKTNSLNAAYAKIDFSNIGIAAIQKLFTDSGIINDLVVQQGKITGELVGVTISGDLIEGNTVKADKLVVRGDDGLYYKLNIDGMNNISTSQSSKFTLLQTEPDDWETSYKEYYQISNNQYSHITGDNAPTWAANTYYKLSSTYENALDGTNIVARSITADKVAVTDLVAFNATIGGFDISNNSIHTHTKGGINIDANGLYFGSDGQIYVGDTNNHIKYYKDPTDQTRWILDIRANELYVGANSQSISDELNGIRMTEGDLANRISQNTSLIEQSGRSLISQVEETINALSSNFGNMNSDLDNMRDYIDGLIRQNTTLIEQYANSIISSVKSTGGSNLLRNSVGYSDVDFWVTNGDVTTRQDDNMSLSGSEFILNGASYIMQGYSTVPGKEYSVSCKIKHTSVGSADTIKIELLGQGASALTIFENSDIHNDWFEVKLQQPYLATITNPSIKISCSGNDVLEITDLMITLGENDIWSGYIDEVYGKEHKLDGKGLRLSDLSSRRLSKTTSSDFQLIDGENIVAGLSKERVKSDSGEFTNGYSIGKLQVIKLDENNIIEYI